MPRIYNEEGEKITKGYVGPLSLGSKLTLICEVDDSKYPRFTIHFSLQSVLKWQYLS